MNTPAVVDQNPAELIRNSTDVAGVCKSIVVKTACQIQGRKYVKVEGWQAIATAHGCILASRDVTRIEGGVRAIGEVRRISDGVVIATAEGFLGDDENVWKNRAEYAKRAMAQTRAMSRVARSAFAHVVVMMDAGLETTPAEEIPHEGETATPPATPPERPAAPDAPPPPEEAPQMREDGRRAAATEPAAGETREFWSVRAEAALCKNLGDLQALKQTCKDKGGAYWTEKIKGALSARYTSITGKVATAE
jgi:hypothetical protein